jgi:glycine oxidase
VPPATGRCRQGVRRRAQWPPAPARARSSRAEPAPFPLYDGLMSAGSSTGVVVVGGGIIGLAVAWQAASAGHAVTVVDPRPGHGATWAAAGMLAPVGEAHFGEDRLTALNLEAVRAWPAFARRLEHESGRQVHLVTDGTLLVAVDPSDLEANDDLLDYRRSLGLVARPRSARQCRDDEPLLAPGIRGGADLVDDHQVDNRLVVDALLVACRSRGVAIVEDEVAEVTTGANGVTGVILDMAGPLEGGSLVVAAGCRSGQLGGLADHVRPPVRPVKGLTLRLRAGHGVPGLRRTVRGLVHGRSCYLVPRPDGSLVVGATVEEQGFDTTVRVGAVGDLLDDARRLVPSLEEYELVDVTTGLRPGTPDNAPIVGRTGIAGLVMATGHYRNGILLAPITAQAVAGMLDDREGVSDDAGPFARFGPGRFAPTVGPAATLSDATLSDAAR